MTYLEIFWIFFKNSLLAFGSLFGTLPEVERIVVLQKHWMSSQDFLNAYVIGQFVPGPNHSMFGVIGYAAAGIGGWLAALAGIYIGSLLVMRLASHYYEKNRGIQWIKKVELALRPLVIGLMSTSAFKLFYAQSQEYFVWAGLLAAGMTWLYHQKKISALSVIFASGAAWWIIGKF